MIDTMRDETERGIYSIPDAARFIAANPRSVRRWALGYKRESGTRSASILGSEVAVINGIEFLSFQQMIELLFVRLFRDHNVSMPVIRAASLRASQIFNSKHPFAVSSLRTDGKRIFHIDPKDISAEDGERIGPSHIVEDLAMGQIVIAEFAQPYFKKISYTHEIASAYWPLGADRHVVIDPNRAFGAPIDHLSGVPTNILSGMHESGDSIDLISRFYKVDRDAVSDAIEFERSLNRAA